MDTNVRTTANGQARRFSILLVGSQMETGGAQRNLFSQATWFHHHGYRVVVAFLYDKEGLHESWQSQYDFPIINLRAKRNDASPVEAALRLLGGFLRGLILVLRNQLNSETRFDAVETFTHHPTMMIMPVAWAAGIPHRIASHRGRISGFPRLFEHIHAWMVNSPLITKLVAVSEQTRIQSMEEGITFKKIVVIPNGLGTVSELNEQSKQKIRLGLCGSATASLILSVGRLNREKGHDLLIEAIPAILQQQPDTYFIFAGDGHERQNLESLANKHDIQTHVRFLGIRKDVAELMPACDIFVLPSRSEGMPNALLEAMGAGTAVVSFNVGGVSDVIQHNKNGMLAPPEDSYILAETITVLLQNAPLRNRLGAEAKETIIQSYSLESMCQNYADLIHGHMKKD
jgi:glycosyltransferase involved in cell wall biosynthesis